MYKQVIVMRKDLKLGKGKIAVQCAHASLGAVKDADERTVNAWEEEGAKKVVVKVNDEDQLKEICRKVKGKLPCFLVKDAGLTQLKAGTITCLGIGPEEERKIDKITGKLKLL
jgi:PTH2 family peptidyl-tRNA hydrolase